MDRRTSPKAILRARIVPTVLIFGLAVFISGCPSTVVCTTDADCTDNSICTSDTCDMATGICTNAPLAGCCEKDGDCVSGEICVGFSTASVGTCTEVCGSDADCADGDPCTDDRCMASVCANPDIPNCDDTSAKTYVGSDACSACHSQIFDWFRNSGHPYKINEVIDGQMPTYPFSSIAGALEMVDDDDVVGPDPGDPADPNLGNTDNQLGTPMSYDDVSYVIGGFGWKARFIDLDGFIVTGSDVQYNLETQAVVGYHNNETDKVFNCGNCHTTGWKAYTSEEGDDRNLNRQGDLPGMAGTFAAPGIQCEACHGAGSDHIAGPSKDNITRLATPRTTEDFLADDMAFGKAVACSDCHTRHGEKDYPTYVGGSGLILASGGLIRHHEQNDELLGINPDDEAAGPTGPHANLGCVACHNPHTTTRYMDVSNDPPGMDNACINCHPGQEITSGGMTGLSCTDCHMPLLAKSAIKHDAVGTGPATGDIKSHIFRIDLSAANQITDDGKYAYPWITGEFACKTCHNGDTSFNLDFPSPMNIHGN